MARINIFLVAGEASADLHGAALLRELRKQCPEICCYGVGGKALAAEGMEIVVSAASVNVVGLTDWFDKLVEVISAYRKLRKLIKTRRPDGAVLLDLPDLNLSLARGLKSLHVPVVYYISPQVWAWRRYRVKKIKKRVDRMLVIFPFEKDFYKTHGVAAEFVGHPLMETVKVRSHYRHQEQILSSPRLALLPGSRRSEIRYHAPILNEVVRGLQSKYPTASFRIPVASTLSRSSVKDSFVSPAVTVLEGRAREALEWCDIAVAASGTATLEAALLGSPLCIFYKMSRLSWSTNTFFRYHGFFGIPNLILGKEAIREFIQERATATNLLSECLRLIEDGVYRCYVTKQLAECRSLLGTPGASERAATQVLRLLEERRGCPGPPFGERGHDPQTPNVNADR